MIDPVQFKRLVDALERIADVLEGTTDDDGLLHVLVRQPEEDEPEDKE